MQRSALCRSRRELSNEFSSLSLFLNLLFTSILIPTSIDLQNLACLLASIQPRASPVKFVPSPWKILARKIHVPVYWYFSHRYTSTKNAGRPKLRCPVAMGAVPGDMAAVAPVFAVFPYLCSNSKSERIFSNFLFMFF